VTNMFDRQTGPTFIIVGAQKCGTTSLWGYLNQHPEIQMCATKELHYFLRELNNPQYPYPNHAWYNSQFPSGCVTGEATPSYCFWPGVIERIYDYNPHIKLIMLLRNPVQRALSHYWMEFQRGKENLPILQAMIAETRRIAFQDKDQLYYHSYISRGQYAEQLDTIYAHFPPDNVHVILLEDLQKQPDNVMKKVCEFIGVDSTFRFDVSTIYRKGTYPLSDNNVIEYLRYRFELSNKELANRYGFDYTSTGAKHENRPLSKLV